MIYKQKEPREELSFIVKNFWMIDSEGDTSIRREKIIPDGYPEMIFNYEQSYRANINGLWHTQEKNLIAGQISNFFYLENTGKAGMFAIKFQPWALKMLYDIDMIELKDRVIEISEELFQNIAPIKQIAINNTTFEDKVLAIENFLLDFIDSDHKSTSIGQHAAQLIIGKKGEIALSELRSQIGISERSLERYFKTYIGLTPKFYSRIIRFSNIFKLLSNDDFNWSDITYLAGFYDQSHFIKNFKEFSGEEPSKYGFTEENMANFFLKK